MSIATRRNPHGHALARERLAWVTVELAAVGETIDRDRDRARVRLDHVES